MWSEQKIVSGTEMKRRGLMLVLSSPSGAGKSTISRALLELNADLTMSVSATTRPMRPGEEDGEHYHFIDQGKFDDMVTANEFLEHATVLRIPTEPRVNLSWIL